jgi:uncharacterized protein (DUF2384 family)
VSVYRKPRHGPGLSPQESARQGRIVRAAKAALGGTDAVRAFLNSHHETLGGRPLDLATASDEGLLAVETLVSAEAQSRSGGGAP